MPVQELKLTVEPKTKTETNPSGKTKPKTPSHLRIKEKRKTERASWAREREKGGKCEYKIGFASHRQFRFSERV